MLPFEDGETHIETSSLTKTTSTPFFYVIMGQCNKAITAKLESLDGCATQAAQGNCLWLLQRVRATMNQFHLGQYPYVTLFEACQRLYNLSQGQKTVTEYYHSFQTEYDTIGLLHGWSPTDIQLDDGVQPLLRGKAMTTSRTPSTNAKLPPVSFWVRIELVLGSYNVTYRITSPVAPTSSQQR